MRISPFKLERFFARYEFKAPYLLCVSDCESFSIQEILELESGSLESFKGHWLGYTESEGNPELKVEISKLYSTVDPSHILVHSGAEEAIFIFMNSILKPEDHVIVHYPCYQSLLEVANSIGCEITKWETKEQNNWELEIDFLEKSIKENTRAIIINCPHNPTGYVMSKDKLGKLVDICKKSNIILFSDEVYRYLEYSESDRLPAVCDIYDNGVSLGVMSKTFGLAGLRIGWVCTKNSNIFKPMASFKDYTSICNSAPSEFLSTLALRHRETIIKRNKDIVLNNLDILNNFFSTYESIFNWQAPKAGSIAFPSIRIEMDVEKFCIDLVEKKGVLLLPSNYYDFGDKNFRIGFGRKNLETCIDKFDEYMKSDFSFKINL